jgi:hypothetical protein
MEPDTWMIKGCSCVGVVMGKLMYRLVMLLVSFICGQAKLE